LASYRVVATPGLRDRLVGAPPAVMGMVLGLVAVLRVDPYAPSNVVHIGVVGDALTGVFAAGRGVLTYRVVEARRLLVLLDLRWV
jgi:hypothetical protein